MAMASGGVEQADLAADGAGRLDVSPVIIFTSMPGVAALAHGVRYVVAERIADGDEADEDQALLDLAAAVVHRVLVAREVGGQFRVGEGQRPHRLAGGGGDLRVNLGAIGRRQVAYQCRRREVLAALRRIRSGAPSPA